MLVFWNACCTKLWRKDGWGEFRFFKWHLFFFWKDKNWKKIMWEISGVFVMDVLLLGNTGENPKVSGNAARPVWSRQLEVRNWQTGIRRGWNVVQEWLQGGRGSGRIRDRWGRYRKSKYVGKLGLKFKYYEYFTDFYWIWRWSVPLCVRNVLQTSRLISFFRPVAGFCLDYH